MCNVKGAAPSEDLSPDSKFPLSSCFWFATSNLIVLVESPCSHKAAVFWQRCCDKPSV